MTDSQARGPSQSHATAPETVMPDLSTSTHLAHPDPQALLAHLRGSLEEHDIPFREDGDVTVAELTTGELRFRTGRDGLGLDLFAGTASNLHMLCETVLHQVDHADPDLAASLNWTGMDETAGPPPNFRLMELLASHRVGRSFQRLRLAGERLDEFERMGLHVRLLLPPEGRAPVWPVVERGRTRWPKGDDALHTPAYTIRRVDGRAGWVDVDVFLHGNGPTCRWAENAAPCATVGMMGPGGGWIPQADRLHMGGDETALPAIARILENVLPETKATAMIEVGHERDILPIAHGPNARIEWLIRDRDRPLAEAFLDGAPSSGAYHWFAAEKAQVAQVRTALGRSGGRGKKDRYVAAYWSR